MGVRFTMAQIRKMAKASPGGSTVINTPAEVTFSKAQKVAIMALLADAQQRADRIATGNRGYVLHAGERDLPFNNSAYGIQLVQEAFIGLFDKGGQ